jgi:predicted nucleotidyltransferase
MSQVYTTSEIKKRLEPFFRNAPIEKAILFGSYAKGIQTPSSDIDIVIDSNGKLLNINFYAFLEDITECLNKQIDLIEMSEIRKDSHIYSIVTQEGIILYERKGKERIKFF